MPGFQLIVHWTITELHVSLALPMDGPYPLILVPGDSGNRVYRRSKINPEEDVVQIWANVRAIMQTHELVKFMTPIYHVESNTISDEANSEIILRGWGDMVSVEYLDSTQHIFGGYLNTLADAMRENTYYVNNKTLRAAPYDFRQTPRMNKEFMRKFKALVEETFELGGNRRVVLCGHSYGANYVLYFLKTQTEEWNRRFIKSFVSIAGPYGGSTKSLLAEASGFNFHIPFKRGIEFRPLQRSLPSMAFLLPDERLWSADEILIRTPHSNYTVKDYLKFFQDIGNEIAYEMYRQAKSQFDDFRGPAGVEKVYCIHGSDIKTAKQLVYQEPSFFHSGFPDDQPIVINGPGDGTVDQRSLEICANWENSEYIVLRGAKHLKIVSDERKIDILRLATRA